MWLVTMWLVTMSLGLSSGLLTFVDGFDPDVLVVASRSRDAGLDLREPHGFREMLVQTFQEDRSDYIELFF